MSVSDPLIGKQLGDYKIAGRIGQGGMARIYKGYDEKLQRFAAVKVFDARAVPGDELEEYRQRFMREARAIARLRHTQIVDVYQTGQFEDYLYIAMMFIDGHDLRYVLKEHAADGTYMSPKAILRVVSDIATALDHAHREKVIHRDIKPSNIMIMDDGHAILTDFGLALSVPEGTTGTTFGSVHYIAPEQATSSALAVPQSDLYSLGVVLFEMLTGRVPFEDTSAMNVALKHITEKPPLLRAFRPEISPTVEAMVLRAIDKTPEKRYQTGADFIQALEQAFGMTDVDEVTRQLEPLPAQVLEAALEKLPDAPPLDTSATARPVAAKADEKVHTDSVGTVLLTPPAGTQRNPLLIAGILVGIVALVGVLALGAAGVLEADITPTLPASTTTGAGIPPASLTPVQPTRTSGATLVVSAAELDATAEAESTPEVSADLETDVPEETEPPVVADTDIPDTEMPTETLTTSPSNTPRPTQNATAAGQGVVRLIYDHDSLVLLNQSEEEVDVSGLTFLQTQADGVTLRYLSDRWAGGSRSPRELPPGDCFQIWTYENVLLDKPDYCDTRHAWRRAADMRGFWLSDVPGAMFKVLDGDDTLAECLISVGECTFDVAADEAD